MGFFDGAGVGLLSALGGAVGSFAGGAMDYKYQKKLMARQNQYNQENAAIAYGRQRELTEDQAYLSQLGKLKAGVNTAFGTDGNVTSSANVDQASPVSVPSPLGMGQQLSTSLRSFLQDSLVNAQRKNVESDTTAKNIDNATRAMENALKIKKLNQDIGVSMLNYAKDAFKFAVDKKYYDTQQSAQTDEMVASAKRAEALQKIDAINAEFAKAKTQEEYNILTQQFKNLQKAYELTDAQIVTEKGKPRVQLSEIRKNDASASASWAQSNLADSQKLAQDIQNGINSDDRVVKAAVTRLINAARQAGPQSFSEYAWSVFNDPNATLGQKWKAGFASILGWVERSLGGDSSRLPGQVYDDLKTAATHAGKGIREKFRSKPGKNRVPVWRR
ncbi:hypothetical protein [Leyella stercorea]|uniref:hypothetical protein n=1 Tax=Leyella stercorea TaxID=363265 RepID=UPI00248B6C21|nr:hypothetical protein [Leyella stercorea]